MTFSPEDLILMSLCYGLISVLCVDYNVELDMVVSGSSDQTVKFWQMSTGSCLATKQGHQDWVISVSQVIMQCNCY